MEEEHAAFLNLMLLGLKLWLPEPIGGERIRFYRYQSGAYEGSPLYFMEMHLDRGEQEYLIKKFCQWYGDTDQDVELFGTEFYLVVSRILDGMLVLNPNYLLLEDVLAEFVTALQDKAKVCYLEGVCYIRDGCRPAPCF